MYKGKITIKATDENDLLNIINLWNNGEVMFYVGFPKGFNVTIEQLKQWLNRFNKNESCRHYSIYAENTGYCGETYYSIDFEHDLATLDIKLLPIAQGKGIAEYALSYAINKVFENNLATKAYVEPNPENKKAWKLYKKLGFISKPRPEFLEQNDIYLEITKDVWDK
ncbi:GNAT family N-acetyltransferase [Clostridium frigidicarnis]|uniref:Protein N-acetyltransferase, RimJ/RimL family n=1 Tax=Clostridium frigidicarnis TaxID=84698 RepID=A0A1I0YAI8_9CLOT|nr:GNAT family protein [Clostridium frigidicarnis]SFB10304.1 Protein N-acetyltransferase, RimJ/RimL family [Clostridium frigidicarnis]